MSDEFHKGPLFYFQCTVAAIFAFFLAIFFIFLSPIFLITLGQLSFRTARGLWRRSSTNHSW